MSVLGPGRRWLRRRRAERLRRKARSRPPAALDDVVAAAERILADGDDRVAFEAVETLSAVARSGEDHPVRDRATDALEAVAADRQGALQATALRSLRYVALEREAVVGRLDSVFADAVDEWDHPDHERIAVDVGMVLGRERAREELPETRERLHEALVAGPPDVRANAALAYVVAADHPDRFDRREDVLEHLAILRGNLDGEHPDPGSTARQFADDRTLDDAIDAYSRADGR